MAKDDDKACPCGGKRYATCCWPYHSGAAVADTPEKLMRARYSAYVTLDEAYLMATWHPSTRPEEAVTHIAVKWLGLEVKSRSQQGDKGTVHFVARCREGGRGRRLEEISQFVFEDGLWYYVDGEFVDKRGEGGALDGSQASQHAHQPGHHHGHGHVHGPHCNHDHDHDHQDGHGHGHDKSGKGNP